MKKQNATTEYRGKWKTYP